MRRADSYVLDRLSALREQNAGYAADRWRIRQIMNGGSEGIMAIMAWDQGKGSSGRMNAESLGTDLPAVNMMASGVERLAQRIGVPPTLKMPYGPRDSTAARDAAEKRERIVEGWDHLSGVVMHYPQIGRWLPGYAYTSWVLRPRIDRVTNQVWPHIELRDPFDTWPGYFGVMQQPSEVAFRRSVPLTALAAAYPDHDWEGMAKSKRAGRGATREGGEVFPSWEGNRGGTQVLEFYDDTGCYVCVPEFEIVADYYPNILDTGAHFHVAKRFSFDRLISQYHHIIGLTAMQAKMNVLALIAAEDSAFKETNIFGELEGNTYEKGRGGQNFLAQNARVEKPTGENNQQIFTQIDRLERQLRIGAAYDQGSDSLAARGGFITGQGQRELRDPIDRNVNEYQKVIQYAMEALDMKRLEWEEKHERFKKKRVFWIEGSKTGSESYVPATDIGGFWRSRRVYGMMATWDDNSKIVAGLQLLQAGVIDIQTMQENLDGIDDVSKVNARSDRDAAKRDLQEALRFLASQGDPRAAMALVEIVDRPQDTIKILKKFFTPQEPQMSPEEQMMAAGAGEAGMGLSGPPPDVQTVLSRLTGGGQAEGGVQTVGTRVG